jgi:hypothetical protein
MSGKGLVLDEIADELFKHAARVGDPSLDASVQRLRAFARDSRLAITIFRRGGGSTYAAQQQKRAAAEQEWAAARYKDEE